MISVGVDVSKGKSTICILKPYGEIVCSPFEVQHEEGAMEAFVDLLAKLDGEIRVVMEATDPQIDRKSTRLNSSHT